MNLRRRRGIGSAETHWQTSGAGRTVASVTSDLIVRDAVEADLPVIARIRSRSFGPPPAGDPDWLVRQFERTRDGRMLVVTDAGGEPLGAGRILPFQQAWRGRLLPMGGVAGVYVEPSARGRGVASRLMRGLLDRMAELGDVVSALFPTTAPLYRGVGYEVGGVQRRSTFEGSSLRALGAHSAGLRARPVSAGDAAAVHRLVSDIWAEQRVDGPMLPAVDELAADLDSPSRMAYLTEGGFAAGEIEDGAVSVDLMAARTPADAAALWSVLGSGSSATPLVQAYLPARDPLLLLGSALPRPDVHEIPWMARVVDLPAAVAARGCSPALSGTVLVGVRDAELPGNDGSWTLTADAGRLRAERTDRAAAVEVSARGLAALWCGWSLARLRVAGLVTGAPEAADEALLQQMLAAEPMVPDYF